MPTSDPSILTEPLLTVRLVWPATGSMEYHVTSPQQRLLATARYLDDEHVAGLLRPHGLRRWTADALRIADTLDQELFTVIFPGMRARAVMFIRDRHGRDLGTATRTKGGRKARYEIRHEDRRVAAIQVLDWRARGVLIEDRTGSELAAIRTVEDGYSLQFHHPVDEPIRSLVVATSVALQAAIGDESKPGTNMEHGGGTTIVRLPLLPPFLDRLRRTTTSFWSPDPGVTGNRS